MSLAREKFHRHREKAVLNVHALEIAEKKLGVTLETLAEKTGLTKSYLSKVERGLNTPSIAAALKLAKALNVQVEELFSEESDGVDGYSIVRRDQRKSLSSGDDGPAYAPSRSRSAPARCCRSSSTPARFQSLDVQGAPRRRVHLRP